MPVEMKKSDGTRASFWALRLSYPGYGHTRNRKPSTISSLTLSPHAGEILKAIQSVYYKVAELLAERASRALGEFAALDTCT